VVLGYPGSRITIKKLPLTKGGFLYYDAMSVSQRGKADIVQTSRPERPTPKPKRQRAERRNKMRRSDVFGKAIPAALVLVLVAVVELNPGLDSSLYSSLIVGCIFIVSGVASTVMAVVWQRRENTFRQWFGFTAPKFREKLSVDRKNLMQVAVDNVLSKFAVSLAEAIQGMEDFLKEVSRDGNAVVAALNEDSLHALECKLAEAKEMFWLRWRLAKRFGFRVHRAYTEHIIIPKPPEIRGF